LHQLISEPLHEQAYNSLKDALRSGRFKPGDVMTIRGLGAMLGISATPVREALQRLIAAQALQLRPNRTIIVPILTRQRFAEITKVRLRLEGLAALEAIKHLKTSDFEALREHSDAMDTALLESRFNDYLLHNERFHFVVYEAAQMPFLRQLIDLAWLQTGPWLNQLASAGKFRDVANSIHREIIAMAVLGDASGVHEAISRDISEAAQFLIGFLDDEEKRPATRKIALAK
jgi:DNA-binding GntR family transcriptional regulator